ncbi:tellurite resistance TerB family protein [Aquipseudomonas ullengensis]|uniref:Tellurite resistance TerB family protein n=1 Tax=Aquipseudomonas ullengensis TaxID=2759166 RepID=A0A7W4LM46_9GAMM|nr:tellurite resistance TerB family protein [Pseudomonas ullengensis]MBB2495670.1 tellurite resistance TerB family protein [Pseudomonas ullengensis]
MNTRGLLDQLLKSGQDLLQQKGGASAGGLGGALGGLLGGGGGKGAGSSGDLGTLLKGAGGGALAAGALGLLLGNKSARKVGSNVITYGGLAALGVIAYKAYGNWQASQQTGNAQVLPPQTVDRLPAPQAELHSQAILKALVSAAKADGHVDERERQLLEEQLGQLAAGDAELRTWLQGELNKPLDPAEVARAASTPEMAAEMYIASVLMVDEEHFMERAYLEELARQLKLEPALKAELEAQVRQELAKA